MEEEIQQRAKLWVEFVPAYGTDRVVKFRAEGHLFPIKKPETMAWFVLDLPMGVGVDGNGPAVIRVEADGALSESEGKLKERRRIRDIVLRMRSEIEDNWSVSAANEMNTVLDNVLSAIDRV